ncbi:MAG: hypothetical protein ACHQ2Y_06045 [Candidatus Lutacidiplasmatales archaeon]
MTMQESTKEGARAMPKTRMRPKTAAALGAIALIALMALPASSMAHPASVSPAAAAPHTLHASISKAVTPPTTVSVAGAHGTGAFTLSPSLFQPKNIVLPGGGQLGMPLTPSQAMAHPGHALFPNAHFSPASTSATTSTVPARPSPLTSSSPSNNYVTGSNCSNDPTITEVNHNNMTYAATGTSLYQLFNSPGDSSCNMYTISSAFNTTGLASAYSTTDGGATWASTFIGQNKTLWQTKGTSEYGSINMGNGNVASTTGSGVLASSWYLPYCVAVQFYILGTNVTCLGGTGAYVQGVHEPWGIDVARSANGGATYAAPSVLLSAQGLTNITMPSACVAAGYQSSIYYYLNIPENPVVTYDAGKNVAVVAWDLVHQFFNASACGVTSGVFYDQATVQISTSGNGGVTWSAPQNISSVVSTIPQVAVGPAPTYALDAVFTDFANTTAGCGCANWAFTQSTNGGSTWSTPSDIGSQLLNFEFKSGVDSFRTSSQPSFAVDNWSASSHSGNMYLVWSDNGTGSSSGYPVIDMVRSTNGGSTWGSVAAIAAAPGHGTTYFMPSVAVGPDGTVWVTFIGVSQSTGNYREYGVLSHNGGASWSNIFVIGDSDSIPGSSIVSIGFFSGLTVTTSGATGIWTDCRDSSCGSYGNTVFFTGLVSMINMSSNAASTPLTLSLFGGGNQVITLPAYTGFVQNVTFSLSVPIWLPDNATDVFAFQSYSGIVSSTNFRASGTYTGGAKLVANYVPQPSAIIAGTFSPVVAGAKLTIDQFPVTLNPNNATTYKFSYSVASGSVYIVNATAPKYVSDLNVQVQVSPGNTTTLTVVLPKVIGWLTGHVNTTAPTTVTLKVNGTVVPVNPATGTFNVSEPWGWYWVNVTGIGVTNYSAHVPVNPGLPTANVITLAGGWLTGTVTPYKATLKLNVDGLPVTTAFGTFNVSVLGGVHYVNATIPGYNLSQIVAQVVAGHTSLVNVTLTNKGWIWGHISPAGAAKNATLQIVSGTNGAYYPVNTGTGGFNVSVLGGLTWTVTVTATGFKTNTTTVPVTAGNGTLPINIDMVAVVVKQNCTTDPTMPGCPGPGQNQTNNPSSFPWLDVVIVVVAIAAVGAIAGVMMMSRRGGGSGGGGGGSSSQEPETPPEQVYGGAAPSELPKLQSDGSMSPPPPPSG